MFYFSLLQHHPSLYGTIKICKSSQTPVLWHLYTHSCVRVTFKDKASYLPTCINECSKFLNSGAVMKKPCCDIQEPVWSGTAPRGDQIETSSCRDPQSNTSIPWRVRDGRIIFKRLKWLWKLTHMSHTYRNGSYVFIKVYIFESNASVLPWISDVQWQDGQKQSA